MRRVESLIIFFFLVKVIFSQTIKHEKAIESIASIDGKIITTTFRNKVSILKKNHEPVKSFFLKFKGYKKGGFDIKVSPKEDVFLISPKMKSYQSTVIFSKTGRKIATLEGTNCMFQKENSIACIFYKYSKRFYIQNTEIRIYNSNGIVQQTLNHYKNSHKKIVQYFQYLPQKKLFITANRRMLQIWTSSGSHIRTVWPRRGYSFSSIDYSSSHNLITLSLGSEVYFYTLKGRYSGRFRAGGKVLKSRIYDYDKVLCAIKKKGTITISLFSKKGEVLRKYQEESFIGKLFMLLPKKKLVTFSLHKTKMVMRIFSENGRELGRSIIDVPYSNILGLFYNRQAKKFYFSFLDRYKRSGDTYLSPSYALEGIIKVYSGTGKFLENIFNH